MAESSVAATERWFRRLSVRQLVAVASIGIVAGLWAYLFVFEPEHHRDGRDSPDPRGLLGSLPDATTVGLSATVSGTGRTVTFGLELCLVDGSESAVVESIGPTSAVGSGVRFLGARIHQIVWSEGLDDGSIGSVDGFPPPMIDPSRLSDAIGYRVTHHCEREYPKAETELLLGFASDGTASGGWRGVDVGYQAGWRHRIVSIHYNLLMCLDIEPNCSEELTNE